MVEQGQAKSPLAWEFGVAPQQWLGRVQLHLQVLPPYWQAEALQASVALLQSPAYHARPAHLAVPAHNNPSQKEEELLCSVSGLHSHSHLIDVGGPAIHSPNTS
jgi:hypothetical protein